MKATCAPHYFRVVRQRRAAEHRSEPQPRRLTQLLRQLPPCASAPSIGPTEMLMPGSTGMELKPHGHGQPVGHPGRILPT